MRGRARAWRILDIGMCIGLGMMPYIHDLTS